jgi:hypothetical protein
MRFAIAALLLTAGCASTSSSSRFLYLDSAYCCGAAEGLGCGLAIEPVLHRIDRVEGVKESATSWDGRRFRIEIQPDADRDEVAEAARGILEGDNTCKVAPQDAVSPSHPGEWFNAEQTVELSRYEASVIASNRASKVAAELNLEPSVASRVEMVMREELEHAFERAHAAGGGVPRLAVEARAGLPAFEARLAEFLSPEQCKQVSAILAPSVGG